jgi:integrase
MSNEGTCLAPASSRGRLSVRASTPPVNSREFRVPPDARHRHHQTAEKLGIEGMSSHSFRRSAPTAAHQAGLNLREVAEISGHRSLAALERYLDQDAAREKAEAARSLLVR